MIHSLASDIKVGWKNEFGEFTLNEMTADKYLTAKWDQNVYLAVSNSLHVHSRLAPFLSEIWDACSTSTTGATLSFFSKPIGDFFQKLFALCPRPHFCL